MSVPWLKNMLGFTLSEKELKDIPYPRLEVTVHVTCKAIQAFVVLGTCLIAPISALWSAESRNFTEIQDRMASYGKTAILLALFVGPLMTYLRIKNAKKEEEVTDRCYRLRKNKVQTRVDRGVALAVIAGIGVASLGLFPSTMFGVCVGIPTGIVLAIIYTVMN